MHGRIYSANKAGKSGRVWAAGGGAIPIGNRWAMTCTPITAPVLPVLPVCSVVTGCEWFLFSSNGPTSPPPAWRSLSRSTIDCWLCGVFVRQLDGRWVVWGHCPLFAQSIDTHWGNRIVIGLGGNDVDRG